MSYASSSKTDYDGVNIPTLPPGIYTGELVGFKVERPKDNQGDWLKRRMVFTFKEDEKNEVHVHTEYEVSDDDAKAESKAVNLVKRVGHILSKFIDKDKLQQDNESFRDYALWVKDTLGEAYKGVKIKFMIVGNVWDGKAKSDFPGYLPFVVKAGDVLGFDNNHTKANKEYDDFMSGGGSPSSTNGNGGEKEEATTDPPKRPKDEPDF